MYVPVACIKLVNIVLAVAAGLTSKIEHLDIKVAFLYASLPRSKEVWSKLSKIEGLPPALGQAVTLQRSLYRLWESPKLWYKQLCQVLSRIRMTHSTTSSFLSILSASTSIVCWSSTSMSYSSAEKKIKWREYSRNSVRFCLLPTSVEAILSRYQHRLSIERFIYFTKTVCRENSRAFQTGSC